MMIKVFSRLLKKITILINLKEDNLSSKALKGGVALGLGTIAERLMRFFRMIILTRLLVPADFGLVAIVMMVVMTVESITETGVKFAIIQNKSGDSDSFLNVAWWLQVARGIILYGVFFLIAPLIADFYNNSNLTNLLRVAFVTVLANGCVSPRIHLLEKNFKFGQFTAFSQASSFLGILTTIIIAFYYRSVWALILGSVFERLIYCMSSHILYPFRPNLTIQKDNLRELIKFTKGVLGLPVMNLISRQADIFVLGKVTTQAILGIYYIAFQLAEQIVGLYTGILGPVLLSTFAKLQDDKNKMRATLLFTNKYIALIMIPITAAFIINSRDILSLLYGKQYVIGYLAFSILAINSFAKIQIVIFTQVFFSIGLPNIHRKISLYRTVLILITIYPIAKYYGINGTALLMTFSNMILLVLQLITLKRHISIKAEEYITGWMPGVCFAILLMISNYFFKFYFR